MGFCPLPPKKSQQPRAPPRPHTTTPHNKSVGSTMMEGLDQEDSSSSLAATSANGEWKDAPSLVQLFTFFALLPQPGGSGAWGGAVSERIIQNRAGWPTSFSLSLSLIVFFLSRSPFSLSFAFHTMASTTTTTNRRNIHRQQTPYLCKRGATFANDNANFYAPATAANNCANANAKNLPPQKKNDDSSENERWRRN